MAHIKNRPEYIDFLLSPDTPLDFHVNVGLPELEAERIGAIKWMLIARSKVLRTMLLQSKSGKTSAREFTVTDLEPETFKLFLTYIYGHDEIAALEFEDSLKLLNAAEKYDVKDLKNRITSIVIPRISVQNVSVVLKHGSVCNKSPLLWDTATEVIQFEIKTLVQLPQFLGLAPEAMVHILRQDALEIEELTLWKATLTWARHQLGFANEGMPTAEEMRKTMGPLLKHTRLCTLQPAELCTQVVPTQVLTAEEVEKICIAIGKKEVVNDLTSVCNTIQPRRGPRLFAHLGYEGSVEVGGVFSQESPKLKYSNYHVSEYNLTTRYLTTLLIKSIEIAGIDSEDRVNSCCFIGVTISYERPDGNTSSHHIDFREVLGRGELAAVPIGLRIEPHTENKIRVQVRCSEHKHLVQWFPSAEQTLVDTNDHLRIIALPVGHSVYNHIKKINYTVTMPRMVGD